MNNKISLITCTIGEKKDCLIKLLNSLKNQTNKNFEFILIDQNAEEKNYLELLKDYEKYFTIKYKKSKKGLSLGRNIGIKLAEGRIFGFPDDDCFYDTQTLKKIKENFEEKEIDILSIRMINSNPKGRVIQKNAKNKIIYKKDVFTLTASISIFIKNLHLSNEHFDENIGLGSLGIFQGGEDYDIVLRALNENKRCYYTREIVVYHPWDDIEIDKNKVLDKRAYPGGAAEMYILNKNKIGIKFKSFRLLRRAGIILYYILNGKKQDAVNSCYILKGMIDFFKKENINFEEEVRNQ
ncbi:glycosyltransferase family A protein [Cetobacterium sp.]|uniref:glycosyltransferase family A protein n=1 Tax=Cetobacterium sp. TaxID=2071632 RepID=UPI003EE438E5